jgi:uncharacterized OsmC-like protein
VTSIRDSIERAVSYLTEHPEEARYTDSKALATLGDTLRVEVEGPNGERIVTDMSEGVGGMAEHPSPGWLYRAAMASCVASTVAMEAAREGIDLADLTVEVDSESDDRGILGMDPEAHVGPYSMRVRVRATGAGVDPQRLEAVVATGAGRCPVCDAAKRSVDVSVEIETS